MPEGVELQTRQALENLSNLAEENGFTLENAVKCTVFLTDMKDFAQVNGEYSKWFKYPEPPARSCVAVAGLPLGGLVEIEAVFFRA